MQVENLFTFSTAFNDKPVYRNTNLRKDLEAFDDLLDSRDSEKENLLAVQMANRVRSSVEPGAVSARSTDYDAAIQSVFNSAIFPSRYGDGTYPVWYGSIDQETTVYETAYHMARIEMGFQGHDKPILRRRIIFEVTCTAILLDFTHRNEYSDQLTDPNSYRFTQQVGKRVRTEGHPGLLAPSARHRDGTNPAIFTPAVLANPRRVRQLTYSLDPASMRLTVLDEDNSVVKIIDGFTVP